MLNTLAHGFELEKLIIFIVLQKGIGYEISAQDEKLILCAQNALYFETITILIHKTQTKVCDRHTQSDNYSNLSAEYFSSFPPTPTVIVRSVKVSPTFACSWVNTTDGIVDVSYKNINTAPWDRRVLLYAVEDRTQATVEKVITDSMLSSSTIITDCLASYNWLAELPDYNYTHQRRVAKLGRSQTNDWRLLVRVYMYTVDEMLTTIFLMLSGTIQWLSTIVILISDFILHL